MKKPSKLEKWFVKLVVNRVNSPLRFFYDLLTVYLDRQILTYAASLSYYLIFSFFPLLILLSAILSMLHLNPDTVFTALTRLLPSQVASMVSDYVAYAETNQSMALLLIAVALIISSASAAFRTLMNASNRIFQKETYPSWMQVVISVALSVSLILLMYLSFVVLITGSWFFHMIEEQLGIRLAMLNWTWMRFLVLFFLLFLFLTAFYRLAIPQEHPRPKVIPGALTSSVALVVASIVFAYFIGLSSKYSLVYGSLASVILLMLWMYLMGNMVLLGSVVNYVLYRHAQFRQDGIPISDIVDNRFNQIAHELGEIQSVKRKTHRKKKHNV